MRSIQSMEPREAARLASILHLPAGITITSIHPSATELVIRVMCHTASMPCPECHQPSTRIHGNYERTVADLPCAGRNVLLMLTVRKFVCSTPACPRKIFTERLPGLVQPYARMTGRLIALVPFLGLVAGGQMGTRLADRVGIATTPPTLLRHLMQLPLPRHELFGCLVLMTSPGRSVLPMEPFLSIWSEEKLLISLLIGKARPLKLGF